MEQFLQLTGGWSYNLPPTPPLKNLYVQPLESPLILKILPPPSARGSGSYECLDYDITNTFIASYFSLHLNLRFYLNNWRIIPELLTYL